MGFGLLLLGYMTVLGFFPDMAAIYLYIGYLLVIPAIGGGVMLAAFLKLQEYNIYFKAMKYVALIYMLAAISYAPFFMFERSDAAMDMFMLAYRIVNICVLFTFHYIMLSGVRVLAESVDNRRIAGSAKSGIYFTYIYFGLSAVGLLYINLFYTVFVIVLGIIYFFKNLACIYRCFLQITYEGHDEEREAKKIKKEREGKP